RRAYGLFDRFGIQVNEAADSQPVPGAADRWIVHQNFATAPHLNRLPDRSVILLERIDSSQARTRKAVAHPAVFAAWKIASLPIERTRCGHIREHVALMGDHADNKPVDVLSTADAMKVRPGPHYGHYPLMARWANIEVDLSAPRSIDVSFAGRVGPYHPAVEQHRRSCCDALEAMCGRLSVKVSPDRTMCRASYDKMLMDTRVVVSPWGNGELCYRDIEAMLAGCVLVKPMPYRLNTLGDVFEPGTFAPCAYDWSNLESVVSDVVARWDEWLPERRHNHTRMAAQLDPANLARWVGEELKRGAA
ncbi:MAG: hypothetical protein COA96_16685, partial [SAR86 cluster bacterium]